MKPTERKHVHRFQAGESKTVLTCACGKFMFTPAAEPMITEIRHTPGPWEIGERSESDNTLPVQVIGGKGYLSDTVALICPKPFYNNPQEADARLISAAPELLECLKWMVNTSGCSDNDPITMLAIVEKSRAAIAKAGGGK